MTEEEHFIHAASPEPVEALLASTITETLTAGSRVLWLLSGGSIIPVAVSVARQLANLPNLGLLCVMQVDERFGSVGHVNSNWQALLSAGFDCGSAECVPILREDLSLGETVKAYETALEATLAADGLHIGLFGIGANGHTAGMLPNSPAAFETTHLASGYKGDDFVRVTMTTPAIARLDLAVAYAAGAEKQATLQQLRMGFQVADQPAQALKQAKSYYIYSDSY